MPLVIRARHLSVKAGAVIIPMDQDFNGRKGNKVILAAIPTAALCIAVLFFLATSSSSSTGEAQEMPGEIVIDNKVYQTDRKGSVWFPHSKHADTYVEACSECHHEYSNGRNVWQEGQPVQKCRTCHDPSKSEGRVKKLSIAFHNSCKACHKKHAAAGGTNAPYKQCTDCHGKP
jgi:hypothetical protein